MVALWALAQKYAEQWLKKSLPLLIKDNSN